MPVFTVHEPPPRKGATASDPERFVFVREGFRLWAFVLPPLWLAMRRLWLALIIYLVVAAAIFLTLRLTGAPGWARFWVMTIVNLLVALEATTIQRWTLTRRKWKNLGIVTADNSEAAERRFFDAWVARGDAQPTRPAMKTPATPAPTQPISRAQQPDVLGLFPQPGSRCESAMSVAIIDYGSGNLHSAAKAFERAAHESGAGAAIKLTNAPDDLAKAERIVLPGVGAFADCRRGLEAIPGMLDALEENVRRKAKPFFGICVGMQLMAERGHEHQVTPGFGWIAGEVRKIAPCDASLKIPHMGWNTLDAVKPHKLFDGIKIGAGGLHGYFVHSYQLETSRRDDLVAQAEYGGPLTAVVGRDNMVGTQFHPEKSQKLGLALIANFLKWKP